eukprot:12846856-Ditylum_brightwellii.AAC.1
MAEICNNLPSPLEAFLHHFSQMEGNNISMASSISAPSAVTINSSLYNISTDYSIFLETVPDESTIEAAKA